MKGSKKYRKLQSDLDKVGIITSIIRLGKKQFDFYVNGTNAGGFKKRDSANKRIVKLHNQNYEI